MRPAILIATLLATATVGLASYNDEPQPHFHDYWGERTEVDIFYGLLELEQDASTVSESGCRSVGHVSFDLETDGNDASPHDPPINPSPVQGPNPKADVVFQGTSHLTVRLVGESLVLPGTLHFRYQPANVNFLMPESGCGLALDPGAPLTIPVGAGAADPAHQWSVSRWKFSVIAAIDDVLGLQLPTVGIGKFTLQMTAHRGSPPTLDPAHPDLYGDDDRLRLGCAKAQVDPQAVVWAPGTPAHRPPKEPLSEIQWTYGKIVPLLTEKVKVRLQYTSDGPVPGTTLELWYHGADTNRYERAPDPRVTANGLVYTIHDPFGLLTDPPFIDQTYWRFMLVPRPPTGAGPNGESVAVFAGDYRLCAVAFRDPDAVLA